MEAYQFGRIPLEISNIIQQTDSGQLELVASNVHRLLKHFNREQLRQTNKPVAFVSFIGQNTNETSLFTNLFLRNISTHKKSWVKEMQRDGLPGFFYGSSNGVSNKIYIEESQPDGIYLWPELFEINHHNDAVKLVGVLYSHNSPDKTSLTALDVILNLLSSSMCEVISNNTELNPRVKEGISNTNISPLTLMPCSHSANIYLQDSGNETSQSPSSSSNFVPDENFIICTDKLALLDKNRDFIISKTRQQLLENLFRCITEQPKLKAKSFDTSIVTLANLHKFILQTVNLVNQHQNAIAKEIAYEYRAKNDFSNKNTNFPQDAQVHNTGVNTWNIQDLDNKVDSHSSANSNENYNTMVPQDDPMVSTILAEFFLDLNYLSRDELTNWVNSFFNKDVNCTSETLFDSYVNDLTREGSLYLKQKHLIQYETRFHTLIQNMAKTKFTNKFTDLFSALQAICTKIKNLDMDVSVEDVRVLLMDFKGEVLKTFSKTHLTETVSFIFHKLLDLYETEIQMCSAVEEKVLQFNFDEMCRIVLSNPFIDSVILQQIQTNLSNELCTAYNSACMGRGKVNALRQKLEQQTSSVRTKHLQGLKDFQIKVTKLINHHKGGYETEMSEAIHETSHAFSSGDLQNHHKKLKEQALQLLSADIKKNIRPSEPNIHLQTLEVYIDKSFVLFQQEFENND